MNSRSSLFAITTGFGILIALIAGFAFVAIWRTSSINGEVQTAENEYLRREQLRRNIAMDSYLADVNVSEFLLDPDPENAKDNRDKLIAIHDSVKQRLSQLSKTIGVADEPGLLQLQKEVETYWNLLDPIFAWTDEQKRQNSFSFLMDEIQPHREAILNVSRQVATMNTSNLDQERQRLRGVQQDLHRSLMELMACALALGTTVALITIRRVMMLESLHDAQHRQIEDTQNNLRRLSRRLVQAQEDERKSLSRELHDEVGQMMTALGIELGNLENLRDRDFTSFRTRMDDVKRLNADAMRAIRDLAMGLRPSMLDDLGLEAALEWQGREFSRHTGVPATVQVTGELDSLTDEQNTCIYRVVQEALTNCARHAKAANVLVSVSTRNNKVVVSIEDDGVGFDSALLAPGSLGLLGIQERVQELDGNVRISSEPRHGTSIQVSIPAGLPA